ncbi:thioesterase II family protein [Mycobacterium sp. ITM-2016-00318]|uniref:thioesterase II family protein n=1 Tax=Mycobacterium sp. ITM-2016-00318 TaxID=2099693 RepID=UPI000D43B62A|nr:alpha/beta fold hydrolase [Mycobacterium sp. ITM-2016-00318]WNG94501.1 alpha/beta fold hydrolase [Mycobacterium sp. ITM-2016-00318]
MRLFCFHHAGGGGAMFNAWSKALGPGVDVVPVEVLNRERFATLRHLVGEVNDQLKSAFDDPHVFFGHSFGALLAYRLACLRAASDAQLPCVLLVSSFAPPHLPAPIPAVDHLDDHQLTALLSDLGGIPPELADWPDLRDRAVATARIDLRLCMTDSEAEPVVLSCPIHAFGGSNDPLVNEFDLHEWRSRTSGEFSVQILRGGHFYLSDASQLLATLRPMLSRLPVVSEKC